MIFGTGNTALQKTTSHRAVVPFYIYAAVIFLVTTVLLFFSKTTFGQHYFNPHSLALTHALALGWGTMIILGSCHQLTPVLTGGKLYSEKLAFFSFLLCATGIPLLVGAFYFFDLGYFMLAGGILVNLGILFFLINIFMTIRAGKEENIHGLFLFTATLWLFLTTLFGLLLAINFTLPFLKLDSLRYLPLHAHMGIVGWFLLLIIGVGSRLIPLFLISKYTAPKILTAIFLLTNTGLVGFLVDTLFTGSSSRLVFYVAAVFLAILLFAFYCAKAFRARLRRKTDGQLKLSLLSVAIMFLPVLTIAAFLLFSNEQENDLHLVQLYGFAIFMGWITAIILGMTFKTFPFIMWNKKYHRVVAAGKTPSPKDLFSERLFLFMSGFYITGFIITGTGIYLRQEMLIQTGAGFLVLAAVFYNWNIFKIISHKPKIA